MSHVQALYQWTQRVQRLFPDLRPHHARTLAGYSLGCVLARTCGLTQVADYLAALLGCPFATIRQRLRELYQPGTAQRGSARSTFDPTHCFGPLLRWAAAAQPNRQLALALDPTCLSDRFRVLAVGILYRGCGLPVAWEVQRSGAQGPWNPVWERLLRQLRAALGGGWEVLVLTDRGLESAELFRAIVTLGWHPLMRVKAQGHFQPTGWQRGVPLGWFAPEVGQRWAGRGLAYPTGPCLPCTLLARWEAGYDEPWLLLTDRPVRAANPAWYAWRSWIEQGFKVLKRGCWQWQHTRMEDPARAARLWAVLAVATLWMAEMGGEEEARRLRALPLPASPRRRERLVKTGIRELLVSLIHGTPLPMGQWIPQPHWPLNPQGRTPTHQM